MTEGAFLYILNLLKDNAKERKMKMYEVRDLIQAGYTFEKWCLEAVRQANDLVAEGKQVDLVEIAERVKELPQFRPHEMRDEPLPFHVNLDAEGEDVEFLERNKEAVVETMSKLMRLPTLEKGALMPDACPAGTICVGGVVAARNAIHPAFHSADICCSMALTEYDFDEPKRVLDAAMEVTHFGPTGRSVTEPMPQYLIDAIEGNRYTKPLMQHAKRDFATQGDGNHFLFVGRSANTGKVNVVTHHGSRSFGARLFKKGMQIAEKFAKNIAPKGMEKGYAWIPFETDEGRDYWEALQIIRLWTMENHYRIHDMIQKKLGLDVLDRFWNEHNFVFKRGDLFYHAKGATPGWTDTYERTLVPMNMSESVLVTRGTDVENGIGFLPHGAGRNMSRAEFNRRYPNPTLPEGIDVRSFSGVVDASELPEAYKNADEVKAQIKKYGLAEVVDEILPYGSIMAGENPNPPAWLLAKQAKKKV